MHDEARVVGGSNMICSNISEQVNTGIVGAAGGSADDFTHGYGLFILYKMMARFLLYSISVSGGISIPQHPTATYLPRDSGAGMTL